MPEASAVENSIPVPPSLDVSGFGWEWVVSTYEAAPGDTVVIDVWCIFSGQGGDEAYAHLVRVDSPSVPWYVSVVGALDGDGRGRLRLTIPADAPVDVPMRLRLSCSEGGDQSFADEVSPFVVTASPSTSASSVVSVATTGGSAASGEGGGGSWDLVVPGVAVVAVAAVVLRRRRGARPPATSSPVR